MKGSVLLILFFYVIGPFVFAQTPTPEDVVLQVERDLAKAYQRSDVAGITKGVMEDYTLINSSGKVTTRTGDLEEAKKVDPKYETFENEDMKVRVHGDTAVVLGFTHVKGVSEGKPFEARFKFTDTFVKDNGQWRLYAGHVTKVASPTEP